MMTFYMSSPGDSVEEVGAQRVVKLTDQGYLLSDQYRNAANLNARIELHRRFSTNAYGWHRWVFDQIDLPARACILELGSGSGALWRANAGRIPAGWEITLTDFSEGMLAEAQTNLRGSEHAFTYAVADAQAIPFAEASFDAIVANHMLYHVPDRGRALAEMRRVMRPGGKLYAATNGDAHLGEIEGLLRRCDAHASWWREHSATSFTLENGAEQLARDFTGVELRRYEDAFVVTETAPLVAYVLSNPAKQELTGDALERFVALVDQEIASHGSVYITKDAGLFIAERA